MRHLLHQWLGELRQQGVSLSSDRNADAIKNLWSVMVPLQAEVDRHDLVDFLRQALEIRRDVVHKEKKSPATFYAWHDEAAGQLRFSTASCTIDDLPFGITLELVKDPEVIVCEFLDSRLRNGIPWADLKEANFLGDAAGGGNDHAVRVLRVWAVALSA